MSVTVVIPTRDRWAFAQRAVATALGQAGDAVAEVVLVDDASTTAPPPDGPLAASRVRVLRADGRGPGAARNLGLQAARTRWVAFLDDDDLWAPDKLVRQLTAADHAGAELAYAAAVWVDEALHPLGLDPAPAPDDLPELLRRYNPMPAGSSNVMVARAALARAGGFDAGFSHLADWDLWLRLAETGTVAVAVGAPLVAYLQHPANMLATTDGMLAEWRRLQARHGLDHRAFGLWLVSRTARGGRRAGAAAAAARLAWRHRDAAFLARSLREVQRRTAAPSAGAAERAHVPWLDALRPAA